MRPRLLTILLAAPIAFCSAGCLTLLSANLPPEGVTLVPEDSSSCPELTGSYRNDAFRAGAGSDFGEPRGRHLAAFFAGIADPSAFDRADFVQEGDRLAITFRGRTGDREVRLRKGVDYSCAAAGRIYSLERTAAVRHRWGSTIRFGKDRDGCLVEWTVVLEGMTFLVVLPVHDAAGIESSRFCPPPAPEGT